MLEPPPGEYEACLALRLAPESEKEVRRLRTLLRVKCPRHLQLIPHATVLYLGSSNQPADLVQLAEAFRGLGPPPAATACQVRPGSFASHAAGHNVHLRLLRAGALRTAQAAARAALHASHRECRDHYVGDRYVPHVTVWDGVAAGDVDRLRTALQRAPKRIAFAGFIVLYKPRSARRLPALSPLSPSSRPAGRAS